MHYVYAMRESASGWVKIGRTNDIDQRRSDLELGLGNQLELIVKYSYDSHQSSVAVELYLHAKFRQFRAPKYRNIEWYTAEVGGMLPKHVNSKFALQWLSYNHPPAKKMVRNVWNPRTNSFVMVYRDQAIQSSGFAIKQGKTKREEKLCRTDGSLRGI